MDSRSRPEIVDCSADQRKNDVLRIGLVCSRERSAVAQAQLCHGDAPIPMQCVPVKLFN